MPTNQTNAVHALCRTTKEWNVVDKNFQSAMLLTAFPSQRMDPWNSGFCRDKYFHPRGCRNKEPNTCGSGKVVTCVHVPGWVELSFPCLYVLGVVLPEEYITCLEMFLDDLIKSNLE